MSAFSTVSASSHFSTVASADPFFFFRRWPVLQPPMCVTFRMSPASRAQICDFFFPTLNQERFILKVASVGLEADPSSQASSKVKKKKDYTWD